MAKKTEQPPLPEQIKLKDRVLAGILAWLVPGLGHLYQGRWAKGVLYLVCILGTFVWGLYLSSSAATGPARAVYLSFRTNDWRLYYFGQIGIGLPALPAVVQAVRVSDDKEPLWNGFMAPPRLDADGVNTPAHCTLADVTGRLNRYFEFATVYTMIAGLLNILAVYDACCGPVVSVPQEKKEKEDAAGSTVGH